MLPSSINPTSIGRPPASQTKLPIRFSNARHSYFLTPLSKDESYVRMLGTIIILCTGLTRINY